MNRAGKSFWSLFQSLVVGLTLCLAVGNSLLAQDDRNKSPIKYDASQPDDHIARLFEQIDQDKVKLNWDAKFGWLPALLDELQIPRASQTLVFSKTSQQNRKIRPSSPRAIYFNDNVYVGFVQKGNFLEIAAADPSLGANFYTIDQVKSKKPAIIRATNECMSCHDTHKTKDVPGFLVRSVFPQKSGHPDFRLGTTRTDHSTPFADRFGGWYVTGTHGDMRHRGNVIVENDVKGKLDREAGANLAKLPSIGRSESHLEPTSDIVALMLLEHQTQFHNHVTKACYTAKLALHHQAEMNKLFERPADFRSDTTKRRLNSAAEKLVKYLFFCDEFKLESAVAGNSEFKSQFESQGVRTADGMSLRELDLQTRLLKYPCSYLVYTESFKALPKPISRLVKTKMLAVLTGEDQSDDFSNLTMSDRKNILKILSETHPMFK